MARSVEEIRGQILDRIREDDRLSRLTSQSKTAVYQLFAFVVAHAIQLLEKLFDRHREEVTTALREQKSGSLRWYRQKALDFQYGFQLIPGTDRFDNGDSTPETIAQSKVIQYASVTESESESRLLIKVAGEKKGTLERLSDPVMQSFKAYIKEIRYAGTQVTLTSFLPDRLYPHIQIFIDPLVLDLHGVSIQDHTKPVEAAFKQHLKELPFNGKFIIQSLVDRLQQVEGVRIVNVLEIETNWIDPAKGGYGDKKPIEVYTLPMSGYFEVVGFEGIAYRLYRDDLFKKKINVVPRSDR